MRKWYADLSTLEQILMTVWDILRCSKDRQMFFALQFLIYVPIQ